jgi:TfoX/Sxy family transcriptional regulator of competence genes
MDDLLTAIRRYFEPILDIDEKKMFGGVSFLYQGKMTIGTVKDRLAVRIVPEKMEYYSGLDETSPMTFTGKPLKEFLYVEASSIQTMEKLSEWAELGLEHAKRKLKEEN